MALEYKKYLKKEESNASFLRMMYKPLGFYIAKALSKTKISPNQITYLSFFLFSLAGFFFYLGKYPYLVIGALCVQLGHISDVSDGMLARIKGITSTLGKWLDDQATMFSRVILYLGITLGLYRFNPQSHIWILGFLAISARYVYELTYTYFKGLLPHSGNIFEEEKRKRNKLLKNFYFTDNLLVVLISLAGIFNMIFPLLIFIAVYGWLFNLAIFVVFTRKISTYERSIKNKSK